jgi:hypothetical protein
MSGWPGAARIAVSFVLNYEEGGERNVHVPDLYQLRRAAGNLHSVPKGMPERVGGGNR